MTSASGSSDRADQAAIDDQRGLVSGIRLAASAGEPAVHMKRAAAMPTATCPMLAIRNGDYGRQIGFTNAPLPATSQTATRAHAQPLAFAFHSNRLLANSRVEASSITSR